MIVSRQNDRIKSIRSLKQKKYRDETNLYLVEGVKSVKEALLSTHSVKTVVITPDCLKKYFSQLDGVEILEVSDSVFSSITDEVSPQGVLAVVEKPFNELVAPTKNSLILDGVADPGNVGAIIRTAAACDMTEIYLINSADPYSPKAVRSSMSGIFKVKTYFCSREEALKVIDCPIIVATMEGENIFSFNVKEKFSLVIGNEANGVSDELLNKCSHKVSIPMKNGVESLNASVSAGVLMYILSGQNLK